MSLPIQEIYIVPGICKICGGLGSAMLTDTLANYYGNVVHIYSSVCSYYLQAKQRLPYKEPSKEPGNNRGYIDGLTGLLVNES